MPFGKNGAVSALDLGTVCTFLLASSSGTRRTLHHTGLLWALVRLLSAGSQGLLLDRCCEGVWSSHTPVTFLLQVPYETLNKRFRAAQKNIDRETSHVTMVVAELEKTLSSCPAVDSVVSLLDGVVEKLSVLKRKASIASGPFCLPASTRAVTWLHRPSLTVCPGHPEERVSSAGAGGNPECVGKGDPSWLAVLCSLSEAGRLASCSCRSGFRGFHMQMGGK